MLLLVLCHLYCRPCLLYFCRLLVTCVWHDLSDNFFVRQKSYDFCRLSDISLRGNIIRTVLYCQCATSSKGTVNKNGSYSLVGPRVFLFGFFGFMILSVCFCMFCFTFDSGVISLDVLVLDCWCNKLKWVLFKFFATSHYCRLTHPFEQNSNVMRGYLCHWSSATE